MASFCATGKWHDCKDVLHTWLMTGSMSTASSCPLSNESPTRWSHWRSRCCRPQCQHTSVTWSSQLFLVSLCDHLMPSCCLFQQREPSLHVRHFRWQLHTPGIHYHLTLDLVAFCTHSKIQEALLSPRDRTMRRVSWNLGNCHTTCRNYLYDTQRIRSRFASAWRRGCQGTSSLPSLTLVQSARRRFLDIASRGPSAWRGVTRSVRRCTTFAVRCTSGCVVTSRLRCCHRRRGRETDQLCAE